MSLIILEISFVLLALIHIVFFVNVFTLFLLVLISKKKNKWLSFPLLGFSLHSEFLPSHSTEFIFLFLKFNWLPHPYNFFPFINISLFFDFADTYRWVPILIRINGGKNSTMDSYVEI